MDSGYTHAYESKAQGSFVNNDTLSLPAVNRAAEVCGLWTRPLADADPQ